MKVKRLNNYRNKFARNKTRSKNYYCLINDVYAPSGYEGLYFDEFNSKFDKSISGGFKQIEGDLLC